MMIIGPMGFGLMCVGVVLTFISPNQRHVSMYLMPFLAIGLVGLVTVVPAIYLTVRVERQLLTHTAVVCARAIASGRGVSWTSMKAFYSEISRSSIGGDVSLSSEEAKRVLALVRQHRKASGALRTSTFDTAIKDAERTIPSGEGTSSGVVIFLPLGVGWLAGMFSLLSALYIGPPGIPRDVQFGLVVGPPTVFVSSAFFIVRCLEGCRLTIALRRRLRDLWRQ